MQVGVGEEVGSAQVPLLGLGSEPSPSAPCSQTPTTIIRTRTATKATTHPPQLTIRRHINPPPRGAVGAAITITITVAE